MTEPLSCIELFTGAGGLALGLRLSGFSHVRLVELADSCVETINLNRPALGLSRDVETEDVSTISWSPYAGRTDLLAAGVPCQPFSFGGKSNGARDHRNAFPELLRALREVRPRAVLVENVKGFASETFVDYFEYVIRQIEMPELERKHGEKWRTHLRRLNQSRPTYLRAGGLAYRVKAEVLCAADYGVPQARERLFIVGYRTDTDCEWTRSSPTHSRDALLRDLYVTGTYWHAHGLQLRRAPTALRPDLKRLVAARVTGRRWRTVRDALADMRRPVSHDDHKRRHFARAGATEYAGHRGSELDWPAKTVKAGVHGVPGGENMLRDTAGQLRYFTLREAARLQTFPDSYVIAGSWTEAFRQLGNAVPVRLARVVGRDIHAALVAQSAAKPLALAHALKRLAL